MDDTELNALHEEVVGLFAQVFAITARAFAKLAEFDVKGCAAMMQYQSTAHYLNFSCGISLGTAREHVRVARALEALPLTKQKFSAGTLSFSKVRALSRIA